MPLERLTIVCQSKDASEELRWSTRNCPGITVHCGDFATVPEFDAIATAGNSFGLMDAGIDLAILKFFGPHVQESIQQRILEDFLGEQPVGTAFIVPTRSVRHPWLVHTPTMRTPMNISGTDHLYAATWATLLAVHRHPSPIRTLVCPAFGTGTGGMSALEAGVQMRVAFEHYRNPPQYINPSMAQARQERVHYGGRWGFQHPRPIQ